MTMPPSAVEQTSHGVAAAAYDDFEAVLLRDTNRGGDVCRPRRANDDVGSI